MNKLPLPPGPHSFAVLGALPEFRKDLIKFCSRLFGKYGKTVSFRFGTWRAIMTISPEFISHILKKNPENYKKSFAYDLMRPIFGNGLLVAHGDHWKENRLRMQTAFGPEQLKVYEPKIEKLTQSLLEEWKKGESRNVQEDFVKLTLGIIGECLFGEDIRNFGPHVSTAMIAIMDHVENQIMHPLYFPLWIPTKRNKKYHESIAVIEDIAEKLIEVVLKQPPLEENRKTLLSRLLPQEMTPEIRKNLRDQIMTLLITGHDTSANILTFGLQVLGQNPLLKERLRESLRNDHSLANSDLHGFINEMMRLFPPVWMASRTTLSDDACMGFRIPKNTLIIFIPYLLQRDETHWKNAEDFDIDRFKVSPPSDTFIPFGAGPRACVAMGLGMLEMKIILRKIISEMEYEIITGKEIELRPTLTLKPKKIVTAVFRRTGLI